MRNVPCFPAGRRPATAVRDGMWSETFKINVITPLLGGGAVAKQPDPITPIRVSSVLGHLRFWWRATAGRRYKTIDQLCAAEAARDAASSCWSGRRLGNHVCKVSGFVNLEECVWEDGEALGVLEAAARLVGGAARFVGDGRVVEGT